MTMTRATTRHQSNGNDDLDLEREMMAILQAHGIRMEKLHRVSDAIKSGRAKPINPEPSVRRPH